MKIKLKFFLITFLMINTVYAEESSNDKNKSQTYKYKEFEVIDLGSMEIKGQIMAPGDITISERERKVFKRSLLEKNTFDFENKREIENLR